MTVWLALAAVVVGTWNGNWFPSGRAEHRAHPDVEAATVTAAARMLRSGLDALDPLGTNDIVLCLHEMRGPRFVSNLVAQVGLPRLRVVTVSGYRRRDRYDTQQDAIATTLPVAASGWSRWKNFQRETPPRGYAFASVVVEPAVTAGVYAVHLKSNYRQKGEEIALNRAKRSHAIEQLVAQERPRRGAEMRPALIVGDFNADRWREEFAGETLFRTLDEAGFADVLAVLPPDRRGTHPHPRFGASALDHVMVRGGRPVGLPLLQPNGNLSDHLALFAVLDFGK